MTLYERYISKETFSLLEILESSEDYTEECIDIIWEIFEFRKINKELVLDDILLINRRKARKKIESFNPLQVNLELHKSIFLDEDEMKVLYQIELKKFIEKQKLFDIDVWKYVIAG